MRSIRTCAIAAVVLATAVASIANAQTKTPGGEKTQAETLNAQAQTIQQQQAQILMLQTELKKVKPVPKGLDAPVDPDTYIIGPSDEFLLSLRGQVQREITLRVLPEGTVILPTIGALAVAGQTITEFRASLKDYLNQYYKNVEFDCQLVGPRFFLVYVLGEVEEPGAVELYPPFRVATAIEQAGGIRLQGSQRYVEIRENGEKVRELDLFSFLKLGKIEENPVLKEGQSVFVPPKHTTAVAYGEVWYPSTFEIRPGETVADIVRFAGGPTNYADFDRVIVESYDRSSRATINRFTFQELDQVPVQNRDIIVLPDRRTFEGGAWVQVKGGGGREGRMFIEEGDTLASFLPRFVRLVENHDIEHAVIERKRDDGSVEYISVDLEDVISGGDDASIELKNGDIISIPLTDDFVFVSGEVTMPGQVEYQRGLPAERYIALAGGPTRAGSLNKIKIYAADGTIRDGNRHSEVFRGDTILLERTVTSYVGPIFIAFTSLTSLVLSVIAVSK